MAGAENLDDIKQDVNSLKWEVNHHAQILERLENSQASLNESMTQFLVYEHKHAEAMETFKRVFKRIEDLEKWKEAVNRQRYGPRIESMEETVTTISRELPLYNYVRVWVERAALLVLGAGITYLFSVL